MTVKKKFIFGAQPALDKAIAEQKVCENALVAARKELEAEKKALIKLQEELEEIRQRIRALYDNLVSPQRSTSDPRELRRVSDSIEVTKLREKQQLARIDEQKKKIAWAADKVELRKRELAEATAQVQALEKLKENRRLEHATALAKAEESRRDDDSIQLWNSQQKKI